MKIKIELFKPEEIIYVVIYRHRNPKKVEVYNKFYECLNKVSVIKIVRSGCCMYSSHYHIKNWGES